MAPALGRLLLRVHHALLDGRGLLALSQDLFRTLRGEAPLGPCAWSGDQPRLERAPRPEAPAPPVPR